MPTRRTKEAFSHYTLQSPFLLLVEKFNGVPERLSISNYIYQGAVGEWVAPMQKEGAGFLVGGKTTDGLRETRHLPLPGLRNFI